MQRLILLILMPVLIGFLSFSYSNISLAQSSELFNLKTIDGQDQLNGQIDFPDEHSHGLPLVVMVPGTGLHDRDVDIGTTQTEKDLIFKMLGKSLNQAGFAVLRYDLRGVRCNKHTMPSCLHCTQPNDYYLHFIKSCFDFKVRGLVTTKNMREDIEQLYQFGTLHKRIDAKKIIVFGHSEGSIHLSYLIKERRIDPAGVVFMGGLAESPLELAEWQFVDRFIKTMIEMDKNRDEVLTNEEITLSYDQSPFRTLGLPLQYLLSSAGSWTKKKLRQWRNQEYITYKTDALKRKDSEPFQLGDFVQASYEWRKMFFKDRNNVLDNLVNYDGPLCFNHGEQDWQVDPDRQRELIREKKGLMENLSYQHDQHYHPYQGLEFLIHRGVGHSLGKNPILGPLNKRSLKMLIENFSQVSKFSRCL